MCICFFSDAMVSPWATQCLMITVNIRLKALYFATIWQPFILNHFSGQQYKSSLDNETNPFVEIICPTATKTITTLTTDQTTSTKWLTTKKSFLKEKDKSRSIFCLNIQIHLVKYLFLYVYKINAQMPL